MGWIRRPLLGRRSERGQATTEYVVAILVSAALVGAVFVAINGSTQKITTNTRTAICRILLMDCGASGGDGTGSTTDGSDDGVDDGADDGSQGSDDDGGDVNECHGFWGCAWNGVKRSVSFQVNIFKAAGDDVAGLLGLIAHPSRIIDAGKYIWSHPLDALKQLVWDDETQDLWDHGDYNGAFGRFAWNVGSWFIPGYDIGKAISKVGKLGKLGKLASALAKAQRLASDAGDLAKAAEKAAARGDLAGARKAAADARKKADDAEATAREHGCPIVTGLPAPRSGGHDVLDPALLPAGGGLGLRAASAPLPLAARPALLAGGKTARGTWSPPNAALLAGGKTARGTWSPPNAALLAGGKTARGTWSPPNAALLAGGGDCGDLTDQADKADDAADRAEAAANDIVPGGGLQAHENLGGHTLDRHVGKSDQDLIDRLAKEPKIPGAGTFPDRATAEAASAAAISASTPQIQAWLNGTSNLNLVLHVNTGAVTGRSAAKGATSVSQVRDVTGVRVVLKKAPGTPLGYYILTSFPEPLP